MALIEIKKLRRDGAMQHRAKEIGKAVIERYRDAYLDGQRLPPVQAVYDGKAYWVWDGFQRIAAALDGGLKEVEVTVKLGGRELAFDLSLSANETHGQLRTPADKRKAVLDALGHARTEALSNREIAKLCAVSHTLVDKIRPGTAGQGKAATGSPAEVVTGSVASLAKPKPVPAEVMALLRERDDWKTKYEDVEERRAVAIGLFEEAQERVLALEAENRALKAAQGLAKAEQAKLDAELALIAENKQLRARVETVDERQRGLMEEKAAAVRLANSLRSKLKALEKGKR